MWKWGGNALKGHFKWGTMEDKLAISQGKSRTSLVIQWLGFHAANSEGKGLILGPGTRIPHVSWCHTKKQTNKQKKKKQRERVGLGYIL